MNLLFSLLFAAACACLLFSSPESFLPAVLDGATDAAAICVALLSSYALWMGLMQVWEDSGVTRVLSKWLRPVCKGLFHTDDEEAIGAITMNLAANLLGIGGAATPYGVKAAKLLDKAEEAEYSSCLFFVMNATSIQLIPTAIVGMRAAMGSSAPADVILPSLLCTALSTAVGCGLTALCLRRKKRANSAPFWAKTGKMQGAGTR